MADKATISPEICLAIEVAASAAVKTIMGDSRPGTSQASPLASVKEACTYLGCSRATLHRLEQSRSLVPKRFGRKVMYDRAELDDYIQREAQTTTRGRTSEPAD